MIKRYTPQEMCSKIIKKENRWNMYKLFSAEACPYVGARVSLPQPSAYIIAYAICNLHFLHITTRNAFFFWGHLQL